MVGMRRVVQLTVSAAVALTAGWAAAADRASSAEIVLAQLTGPDRASFIQSSIASCTDTVTKNHSEDPADVVKVYCTCMADGEADVMTEADLSYINQHKAATPELTQRIQALAPACNAKAGLK